VLGDSRMFLTRSTKAMIRSGEMGCTILRILVAGGRRRRRGRIRSIT
jgi:hypothetical protein